jgi:phospholipase/carboxylesterase
MPNKAASRLVLEPYSEEAVIRASRECLQELGCNPSVVLVFATSDYRPHLADFLELVQLHSHATLLLGGSAWGLIGSGVEAEAATGSLVAWFDALAVDYPDIPSVHLLGFSQGGAMSLELMRHRPHDVDSVLVLAGFALPAESPEARARDAVLAEVRPPVFWGRDAQDPVISPPTIELTRRWLPEHADLTARLYSGVGHGINLDELEDVAQFLRDRLVTAH